MKLIDTDNLTQTLTALEGTVYLYYSPSPNGKPLALDYHFVSYGIPFLIGLIMAVPEVKRRLRLKILLLGLLFLYPCQIAMLLIGIFKYYSSLVINGIPLYSDAAVTILTYAERIMTRLNGELAPLLLWAGLYYYYKWHVDFPLSALYAAKRKGGS